MLFRSAPTPSAAAELGVPKLKDLKENLETLLIELTRSYLLLVDKKRKELQTYYDRLNRFNTINKLNDNRQYLDGLFKDLINTYFKKVGEVRSKLEVLGNKLDLLSPLSTANRGYGILTNESDKLIKSVEEISVGERFHIILKDGVIDGKAEKVSKGEYRNGSK